LIAVDLIKELHRNGIRVIFDGVFNHSGPGHWSFEHVMLEGDKSKYKSGINFMIFQNLSLYLIQKMKLRRIKYFTTIK
jgi:1,4-alpha-glucan branching enzyme